MKRAALFVPLILSAMAMAQTPQWSAAAANDWYARQPWLVGSNYIQSNTVNQLEMWQPETFDADRVDMELGWAENLGMNTIRVVLQDLLWQHDSGSLQRRMGSLLKAADKHKMKVIFVLFDSSGDPFPEIGRQRQAKPGVRRALWAQSPGAKGLTDPKQTTRLLAYAEEVVAAFSIDKRVLAWDVWNEPDNMNAASYGASEPANKIELVQALLPKAFQYARAGNPTQPVTSGVWKGDWSSPDKLDPIAKTQLELSDVISFQNYDGPEEFEKRVKWLQAYGRPILCTGFLARSQGSTVEAILPIAKKYNVGALLGDLVAGKPQMMLPWDSWQNPYTDRQPDVWFQDIFRSNGAPYKQEEVNFIKEIIGTAGKAVSKRK
ncbi:MAG TPA: hypothetical protein VLY04_11090 [Bryobacteraceae bacterium]|nr:hypothetical protein [Bryobacteraceae bacterium]